MKYLLVVGFSCDVYQQEPRARIFVGNQLIDEFYIQYHKDTLCTAMKKFSGNRHILQNFSKIDYNLNIRIKNLPPLRFYEVEIDQSHADRLELRIEINNNDNNYTNGFMTSTTLLQLRVFYFFPLNEKLLTRLDKIMIKNRLNKNYSWLCRQKSFIFDLVLNGLQWQGKNGQIFNSTKNTLLHDNKIGGDGNFTCELIKKYGIFIPILSKPYRYNFNKFFLDHFYDKYQQHANQRDTN
jgi:hypothetical protein